MADGPVMWLNNVDFTAADLRLLQTALLQPVHNNRAFGARSGKRPNMVGLSVSVNSAATPETATIVAGSGVIFDTNSPSVGPYLFALRSTTTKQLPARPSSGLSRIILVVARVYDVDANIGTTREMSIEFVSGTPASTPTEPSLPAMSLLLATIVQPDSAGSYTVTQARQRTVAAGGILPVDTTAERDALNAWDGLTVANAETGRLETWFGSAWRTPDSSRFLRRVSSASGGSQTIPAGLATKLAPNTSEEAVNTVATWASGEYTIQTAGIYRFGATAVMDSESTGRRALLIYINDNEQIESTSGVPASSYPYRMQVFIEKRLAVGDRIGARVFHNVSAGLAATASAVTLTLVGS